MPDKAVKSTQTNQTTNPRLDPIDKSETAGWWKEKLSSAEVFEANQSKNPAFRMRRITFSMLLRNYKEEIKNTPFVVLVENKPVFKVVSLNATFIDLDRPSNKIDWTLTPEEEAQQAKDQAEYEAAKKAKLEAQTSTPPSVTTPVPPPVDPVQIAKELTPEEKVKTESFIEAKLKQIGNFFQPEQEKAAEETPVQKVEAPPAPFIKEAWVVPAPQMSPLEAETKAQIDPM